MGYTKKTSRAQVVEHFKRYHNVQDVSFFKTYGTGGGKVSLQHHDLVTLEMTGSLFSQVITLQRLSIDLNTDSENRIMSGALIHFFEEKLEEGISSFNLEDYPPFPTDNITPPWLPEQRNPTGSEQHTHIIFARSGRDHVAAVAPCGRAAARRVGVGGVAGGSSVSLSSSPARKFVAMTAWLSRFVEEVEVIMRQRSRNGKVFMESKVLQKLFVKDMRTATAPILAKYYQRAVLSDSVAHWRIQAHIFWTIGPVMRGYSRQMYRIKMKRGLARLEATKLHSEIVLPHKNEDREVRLDISHIRSHITRMVELREKLNYENTYLFISKAYYEPKRKRKEASAQYNSYSALRRAMELERTRGE